MTPRLPYVEPLALSLLALLALVVLLLAGCPRPVPPVVPTPPTAPCLVEAPPVPPPVVLAGPDAGCPPAFVGCLDVDAALALEARLRAAGRWEREAWARCGTTPAPTPAPADGGAR